METIILLFLFILIPLVNYVLERMRRRSEPAPDVRRRAPDPGVRRQATPPAPPPVTRRERAQQTPSVPVERRESRRKRRALFSNKRDVRRAIIAMTILGPCRAYDPPDEFQR